MPSELEDLEGAVQWIDIKPSERDIEFASYVQTCRHVPTAITPAVSQNAAMAEASKRVWRTILRGEFIK